MIGDRIYHPFNAEVLPACDILVFEYLREWFTGGNDEQDPNGIAILEAVKL